MIKSKYLLVREKDGKPVYDLFDTVTDLCAHMKGLNKGMLWRGHAPDDWKLVAIFNETEIKLSREIDRIPADLISALL